MTPPIVTRRFSNAPLWSSNGFNSDPFKKAPKAKRSPKVKEPKEYKAQERPVLHVHADGKRKGIMVVPKEIADKCGPDAATIMAMISTHAPTFQHCHASIAAECQMSMRRVSKACVALEKHGYACRVTLHGGRLRGTTLQTNANGNIQPLTGSVLPYYCEDGSIVAAERPKMRRSMRRWKAGIEPKGRRETGRTRASTLNVPQTGSEVRGGCEPSPCIPYNVNPHGKEK